MIPTNLESLRAFTMAEMSRERPDRMTLKLCERLLRSYERVSVTTEKDERIRQLEQELDATRERTLDSSVIRDYKNRKDALEREITTVKSDNVDLKTRVAAVGSLSAENERLRATVSRIHDVLKSKTGELWSEIQRRVNEAENLQDFESIDVLTAASKEIEELMSLCQSSETRINAA